MQVTINNSPEAKQLKEAIIREASKLKLPVGTFVVALLEYAMKNKGVALVEYFNPSTTPSNTTNSKQPGFDIADVIKDLEKKPKLTDRLKKRDPEAQTYIDRGLLCIDDSVRAEIAEAISKLGDKEAMDYLDSTGMVKE